MLQINRHSPEIAPKVPQRSKDRASAIRLSAMGWKVEQIAIY
jgi:hypothetical protein